MVASELVAGALIVIFLGGVLRPVLACEGLYIVLHRHEWVQLYDSEKCGSDLVDCIATFL